MSIEAMNWAFEQDIKPSSMKFVLVSLGDNAQHDGMAWPSIAALCSKTGQDRKTVIAALGKLEELGYLVDSGKRIGNTGQIKVYQFNFNRQKSTENGTVPKTEQYRNFRQRVPKTDGKSTVFPHKSTENGTRNPQEPKEPSGKQNKAQAPENSEPEFDPSQTLADAGVPKQVAKDWLKVRRAKSAPLTQTAWDDVVREAGLAGIDAAEAVRIAAANSWQGFKASWVKKAAPGTVPAVSGGQNRQEALEASNRAVAARLAGGGK